MTMNMYDLLKDVKPELLTRKEYAVLVREASEKLLPDAIAAYEKAKEDLKAWEIAHPGPTRPVDADYNASAKDKWLEACRVHRNAWGHKYQKRYYQAGRVEQLELNIELSLLFETDSEKIAEKRKNGTLWSHYRGVNCPLLCHGTRVYTALARNEPVPAEVAAEWPDAERVMREAKERN